jgi:hypothetical protein
MNFETPGDSESTPLGHIVPYLWAQSLYPMGRVSN